MASVAKREKTRQFIALSLFVAAMSRMSQLAQKISGSNYSIVIIVAPARIYSRTAQPTQVVSFASSGCKSAKLIKLQYITRLPSHKDHRLY